MRVLALDVGEKRIGVALSDPSGVLAFPLTTLPSASQSQDVGAVLRLAAERDVELILVGLPLSLSGRMGPQASLVARFAESLASQAEVPVKTVDERFSTVEAERLVRDAGGRPARQRARVDAEAASVILQSYLDSTRDTPQK